MHRIPDWLEAGAAAAADAAGAADAADAPWCFEANAADAADAADAAGWLEADAAFALNLYLLFFFSLSLGYAFLSLYDTINYGAVAIGGPIIVEPVGILARHNPSGS